MAISRIPRRMQDLAEALLHAGAAARAIRSHSGDMLFQQIHALQHALADARAAARAADDEIGDGTGGKLEAAVSEMARHGFVGTPAEFRAGFADLRTRAAAWRVALHAALDAERSMVFINQRPDGDFLEFRAALPGPAADALRAQGALDDLIAGFAAIGA